MSQRSSPLPINFTQLARYSTDSFFGTYPGVSSVRTTTTTSLQSPSYPLPYIKALYLHHLDETTFALLLRCTHLQHLTIEGEIDYQSFDQLVEPLLSKTTALTSLDIRYRADRLEGVQAFSRYLIHQLRHLALRGPTITTSDAFLFIQQCLEKAQQLESFTLETNSEYDDEEYDDNNDSDPSCLLDHVPSSLTTLKIFATPYLGSLLECLERCNQLRHVVISAPDWDSSIDIGLTNILEILGVFILIHQLENLSSFEFGRVSSTNLLTTLGSNNDSTIQNLTTQYPTVIWKSNNNNNNNNSTNHSSFLLQLTDHDEDIDTIQREQLSNTLLREFPQMESIRIKTVNGVSFQVTKNGMMKENRE